MHCLKKAFLLKRTEQALAIAHFIVETMLGRLWILQAALVISVAAECDKCDDTVMLQSSASRKKDIDVDAASTWTSPRDVAVLREPDQVRSSKRCGYG